MCVYACMCLNNLLNNPYKGALNTKYVATVNGLSPYWRQWRDTNFSLTAFTHQMFLFFKIIHSDNIYFADWA